MKLYATVSSDRRGRDARKGGDECVHIELEAFGNLLGELTVEVLGDSEGKPKQYLISYLPNEEGSEGVIIEEGHRETGLIQRIKA